MNRKTNPKNKRKPPSKINSTKPNKRTRRENVTSNEKSSKRVSKEKVNGKKQNEHAITLGQNTNGIFSISLPGRDIIFLNNPGQFFMPPSSPPEIPQEKPLKTGKFFKKIWFLAFLYYLAMEIGRHLFVAAFIGILQSVDLSI